MLVGIRHEENFQPAPLTPHVIDSLTSLFRTRAARLSLDEFYYSIRLFTFQRPGPDIWGVSLACSFRDSNWVWSPAYLQMGDSSITGGDMAAPSKIESLPDGGTPSSIESTPEPDPGAEPSQEPVQPQKRKGGRKPVSE